MKWLSNLIARQIEPVLQSHQNEMLKELHNSTCLLDESLRKIDIMIARSDARVEAINHMVDNCLELSRTMASSIEKASDVVRENSTALTIATQAHAKTEETFAISVKQLQERCNHFQASLAKEQENTSDLRHSIHEVKDTLDHFVSSALRPNINVNHKP